VRACCLLALTIAVGTGAIGIVALYCVVVALGVFELVTDNAASSLVPAAAGRQELDRANSWVQGGQLVAQNFVAVPLAAALFAAVAWGPFLVASSAYTLAAIAAVVLRRTLRPAPAAPTVDAEPAATVTTDEPPSYLTTVMEGWSFVRGHATLRRLIGASALLAGAVALSQATMMVYLVTELQIPEQLVGILATSLAVGGLLGMQVSVRLSRRRGRRLTALTGVSVLAAGLLTAFAAPGGVVAAIALVAMAFGAAAWNIAASSARQALTPDDLLGRVLGTTSLMLGTAQVLGALTGGFIARLDLRAPFLTGAVLCLALLPLLHRTQFDAAQVASATSTSRRKVH